MNRPVAIINGSITTPDGEVASGIVLIRGGMIMAAGPDHTVPLPVEALIIDAAGGYVSAGEIAGADGPIMAGRPADLVCRTRFGEVMWAMRTGLVVYPPAAALANWQSRRQAAIDRVETFLRQRSETRHLQRTADIPGYQKRGIDLLWRFQAENGEAQSLSLRVTPALALLPQTIIMLDGTSARKLPAAGLSTTRAHWWFYVHEADDVVYCLPVVALKRWMDVHAKEIPPVPVQVAGNELRGRALSAERLLADLGRARVIQQ